MCIDCGCSTGANIKISKPESIENQIEKPQTEQQKYSFANAHSHILSDGSVVTHSHKITKDKHSHYNEEVVEQKSLRPTTKIVSLEKNVLTVNDNLALENRNFFRKQNILALNLVSSPGAGKTTLLVRTIKELQTEISFSVIEGDQSTTKDAEKIKATNCDVVQINTDTACHLEAKMIQESLNHLKPKKNSILAIENVGNLVCPALFDLGEYAKVVILSVTEGEDKPIKYPHMFRASSVMILTKIDLLPYLDFDVTSCINYALNVNPKLKVFQVSAVTGEGLKDWFNWLKKSSKI